MAQDTTPLHEAQYMDARDLLGKPDGDGRTRPRRPGLHGAGLDYFTLVDASDVRNYWHTDTVHTGRGCWQPVVIRLSVARYVADHGQPVKFKTRRAAQDWLKAQRSK